MTIKGKYGLGSETNFRHYGGLMLHCQANDDSSPWHNFVTDQEHWKISDGGTPCTRENGELYIRKEAFMQNMKNAGAIQIWSDARDVTLIGAPSQK